MNPQTDQMEEEEQKNGEIKIVITNLGSCVNDYSIQFYKQRQ